MRGRAIRITLAILIAAALGIGYLADNSGSHTRTSAFTGQPIPVASIETANITVGGAPRAIAVNPNDNRIYVADWFSNNLTVVDASSHSVVAKITLPASSNNGIAIDSNTNMVYV